MSTSSPNQKKLPGAASPIADLEPFAKVKLIAFDLDGTLLKASDGAPGPRILTLQASAQRFGVRLTVATGRTLTGIQKVLSSLGNSRIPAILYNGGLVIEPTRRLIVSRRKISAEASKRIIALAKRANASVWLYGIAEDKLFPEGIPDLGQLEQVNYFGPMPPPMPEFNGMPVTFSDETNPAFPIVAALIFIDTSKVNQEIVGEINQIDGISVTSSGGKYIEIRPKDCSKATGMADLTRSLGYQPNEVLAVGDNDNDLELLDWAGVSVAVNGASPAAQAASTYISMFGAERAAIEVLDLVRMAKRLFRGGGIAHGAPDSVAGMAEKD